MKLENKLSTLTAASVTTISTVAAHSGDDGAATGMMMDGGWMHNAGHMAGYNMWGMGRFGLLFGLAIWILVILGIIYLYQEVTEDKGGEEE